MEGDGMKAVMLTLRWVALAGILASIASLEYMAGDAAGWGPLRSAGVPLGIDTFAMGVLLAPRSRAWDRVGALGLMEFTVVVSAIAGHHEKVDGKDPNVTLGAVLATALVFALWRLDETIRADRQRDDDLADTLRRMIEAESQAEEMRGHAAAARGEADRLLQQLKDERTAHAAEVARFKDSAPVPESATRQPAVKSAEVVPDGELARIVREAVTGHADGWGKVKAAIEAAGYSVGNTGRVKAAIAQRKADLPDEPRRGLAAVGGGR